MSENLLDVRDLRVAISGSEVLRGITFAVPAGGAVALVGASGSGKTMTARALTGLLGPIGAKVTAGSITIGGVTPSSARDRAWRTIRGRQIALVPQNSMSSLDPLMTVGSQLRETIIHAGHERRAVPEVDRLLRQVHLDPAPSLLRAYSHELSGGMRQRVMIALALALRPALLVADEPTTALDVSVRSGILALLTELRHESGLSLVLISHDLIAVEQATEEMVVMHHGAVVEAGLTTEVIRAPREQYTRVLMAARPELAQPGRPIPLGGTSAACVGATR